MRLLSGETVASSQKEDCIGGDVSVSTLIACRVYECAIGEEYPQVKQSESITQCSATPAPSSRPICTDLSIASHIAMFQTCKGDPETCSWDLSLRLIANEYAGQRPGHAPRPWPTAPRCHDAFTFADADFMIQKDRACIQSMMLYRNL